MSRHHPCSNAETSARPWSPEHRAQVCLIRSELREAGRILTGDGCVCFVEIAADGLRGRVYDVSLADLQGGEEVAFRKFALVCEEVRGKNCLTNFHGMNMTTDKLRSLVKKWQV